MALDIAVDKANTVSSQHWAAVVAVALLFVAELRAAVEADTGPDWMDPRRQIRDKPMDHVMNSTAIQTTRRVSIS